MNQKLPYYMAYPMPLAYDDERVERMDLEYMKSLYPALAKRILPYIEEECDRMEYGNSVIYDEYPDRLQLQLMCGRIYENVRKMRKDILKLKKCTVERYDRAYVISGIVQSKMPESQDTESILYKRQFLDRLNGGSAGRYTCMKYELCAIIRLYIDARVKRSKST